MDATWSTCGRRSEQRPATSAVDRRAHVLRNTIENNLRRWDLEHPWTRDGDEWNGQAKFDGISYDSWKQSVVDHLIAPRISSGDTVLEIGPGHGRWSRELAPRCARLILVDLSPRCIASCREALGRYGHVSYVVNDGLTLPGVRESSVDFVWSFDTFVHVEPRVMSSYLAEIHRVLRPEAKATIHHPGRRHTTLWLGALRHLTPLGRRLYGLISMGKLIDHDGWRSNVSAQEFRDLAREQGLEVLEQAQAWGPHGAAGVRRFGDFVTMLQRPVASVPS